MVGSGQVLHSLSEVHEQIRVCEIKEVLKALHVCWFI